MTRVWNRKRTQKKLVASRWSCEPESQKHSPRRSEVKWRGRRVDYLFYPVQHTVQSISQSSQPSPNDPFRYISSLSGDSIHHSTPSPKMYLQQTYNDSSILKYRYIKTVSSIIKLHIREWKSNALIEKSFSISWSVSEIMPLPLIVAQRAVKSGPHVKETYR